MRILSGGSKSFYIDPPLNTIHFKIKNGESINNAYNNRISQFGTHMIKTMLYNLIDPIPWNIARQIDIYYNRHEILLFPNNSRFPFRFFKQNHDVPNKGQT